MDVPSHSGKINLASFLSRLSACPFTVSPFEPMLPFKPVLIACGDRLLSPYWGMSMSVRASLVVQFQLAITKLLYRRHLRLFDAMLSLEYLKALGSLSRRLLERAYVDCRFSSRPVLGCVFV